MESEHGTIGGFTALNTGVIADCYCVYVTASKKTARCFSEKNTGKIYTSLSVDRGRIEELWNGDGRTVRKTIQNEDEAKKLGFHIGDPWEYAGGKTVLRFFEKSFFKELALQKSKPILIKSACDLESFCDLVNKGDQRMMNAHLLLAGDIDGKGKNLPPIGNTRQNAFLGVFDGGGYTIKNYRVVSEGIGNVGFFGYLRGTVANLSLDIFVKGEGNPGILCGTNDGNITCCGAVGRLSGKGDRLNIGGLTGQNFGRIERSYAAVQIAHLPIPILPIALFSSPVLLLGIVAFLAIPAVKAVDTPYSPIASDSNQIRIPEEEGQKAGSSGNSISFRFNETLHIDAETGNVYIDFKNPSYAKNNIVVTLEAKDDRSVMARTGAISPGYGVDYLRLNDNGYEKINSGAREGVITLKAYSVENNDKAMIDTELPVHIVIDQ